jgi:hypothetical protein
MNLKLYLMLSLALQTVVVTGVAQPKNMNNSTNSTELATFGGGCYWCIR